MSVQKIFKRHEMKYMLTYEQYEKLKILMKNHMQLDKYGKNLISNLYFDTNDFLLIRRSIEKPCYKEKLRVRGYAKVNHDSNVFIELKKKYKGIVYKRRIIAPHDQALAYLMQNKALDDDTQITHELDYFKEFYHDLAPRVYLSYEREAYFGLIDHDFRITFDQNILARDYDVDLTLGRYGNKVVDDDTILMEVKTSVGLPKWLLDFFAKNHIYKTSFSKYGTAYKNFIIAKMHGGTNNVA